MNRRRLRWLLLVYGIFLFIWLSVEDLSIVPVMAFGLGAAILISVLTTSGKLGRIQTAERYLPLLMALRGALIGALTSVMVVVLMFFKNARHSHLFPDYPPAMMLAILRRAPVWVLAGGLIGLSLGLGWLVWRSKHEIV